MTASGLNYAKKYMTKYAFIKWQDGYGINTALKAWVTKHPMGCQTLMLQAAPRRQNLVLPKTCAYYQLIYIEKSNLIYDVMTW